MSRQEALDRFKTLRFDRPFQESIAFGDYVLTPQKPIAKARNVKKTRNIRELSPGYVPLMVDGGNA